MEIPPPLQTIVNGYLLPEDLKTLCELGIPVHTEHLDIDLKGKKTTTASVIAPYIGIKSVRITNFKRTDTLAALITLKLKVLCFDGLENVIRSLPATARCKFITDLQEIAYTLEEFRTGCAPEELQLMQFPHLRELSSEWVELSAPQLTSLDLYYGSIDFAEVVQVYPNICQLSIESTLVSNCHLIAQLPLTHLTLNNLEYDDDYRINIETTAITDLDITQTQLQGGLPHSLRHLEWDEPDFTLLHHLHLHSLFLNGDIQQPLTKIDLSGLTKLDLTNIELNDDFFINGPILTELSLYQCTVMYTGHITSPLLKIYLNECECTNFLPATVVDLALVRVIGDIVKSVQDLPNLRKLHIAESSVNLDQLHHLNLTDLAIYNVQIKTLTYLNLNTLRSLTLGRDTGVTNAMLSDIAGLNLIILKFSAPVTQQAVDALFPRVVHRILR